MDKIIVDTKLKLIDFLQAVNDIVLEYFNVDGDYQPQIGEFNAIRVFYNLCVKNYKDEEKKEFFDITEMEDILQDNDFIIAYNNALKSDKEFDLDFANAYKKAMEIVSAKMNSTSIIMDKLKALCYELLNNLSTAMNDEQVKKIIDLSKYNTEENIVDSLIKSYTENK